MICDKVYTSRKRRVERASTNLSQCSAGEAHSAGGTLSLARAVPLGEPRAAAGGEGAEEDFDKDEL